MIAALRQVDFLLRDTEATPPSSRSIGRLLSYIFIFGIFYGAVMGAYGGFAGQRILQPVYSGVKVPILLLLTFLLSIPSFYVLNVLLGLSHDFRHVLRALIGAQAVLTIVLASFAPITAFFYLSSSDHDDAILFNAFIFAVASLTGQWALRRSYKPLIAKQPRHRWLLRIWLFIYAFVGIQMGWVFRPFIGDPSLPTTFLRPESWSNAYQFLLHTAIKAI